MRPVYPLTAIVSAVGTFSNPIYPRFSSPASYGSLFARAFGDRPYDYRRPYSESPPRGSLESDRSGNSGGSGNSLTPSEARALAHREPEYRYANAYNQYNARAPPAGSTGYYTNGNGEGELQIGTSDQGPSADATEYYRRMHARANANPYAPTFASPLGPTTERAETRQSAFQQAGNQRPGPAFYQHPTVTLSESEYILQASIRARQSAQQSAQYNAQMRGITDPSMQVTRSSTPYSSIIDIDTPYRTSGDSGDSRGPLPPYEPPRISPTRTFNEIRDMMNRMESEGSGPNQGGGPYRGRGPYRAKRSSALSTISTTPDTSNVTETSLDPSDEFQLYTAAYHQIQANISASLFPLFDVVLNITGDSTLVTDLLWSVYSDMTGLGPRYIGPYSYGRTCFDWLEDQYFAFNKTSGSANNGTTINNSTSPEVVDLLATNALLIDIYDFVWQEANVRANATGLLEDMVLLSNYLNPSNASVMSPGWTAKQTDFDSSYFLANHTR